MREPASTREPRAEATVQPWLVVATAAVVIFFLVLFVATGARIGNIHTGDTDNLVKGARVGATCIDRHVLLACGRLAGSPYTEVFPYPLLQYIPASLLLRLGFTDSRIVAWLAHLNTVSFFASLACLVLLGRGVHLLRLWIPELLVVLFTGPLLFYAVSGVGEMLVAFLGLAFVAAAITQKPILACFVLAAACLGKETLAPFLLVLGLACARGPEDGWLPPRRMLVSLIVGTAMGVAVNAAFNVFRFGSGLNAVYLQPQFQVPGMKLTANFFAALWIAPSGGLLWFWISSFALFALIGVVAVRHVVTNRCDFRGWAPAALVLLLFAGFQLGLAKWVSPFGWIAWGPRLTMPVVPAMLVAGVYVSGSALREMADRILRSVPSALAVGALIALSTLPQAGSIWAYDRATTALLAMDRTCPGLLQLPLLENDPVSYFSCISHIAWRTTPSNLLEPVKIERTEGRVGQVSLATAAMLLVLLAHRQARGRFHVANLGPD